MKNKYLFYFLTAGYLFCVGTGFWLLFHSRTSAALSTPWQTIHPAYIYVFFLATLILGILLAFSKIKTWCALLLLTLYSLLLYSYLPLTHSLLYGADGWRHLAEVNRLIGGNAWREVANSASGWLGVVGRVSYFIFWVIIAVAVKILGVSGLSVLRYLQPILAAIFLPALGFFIGRALGFDKRLTLLSAWFMNWSFALQMAGAFTLPSNFWFLIFLGALIVILRASDSEKLNRKLLFAVFLGLCLGYSLYPILFGLLWMLVEIARPDIRRGKNNSSLLYAAGLGLVIPALDWLSSASHLVNGGETLAGIRQMLGNILGWYLATGPRPHDIATGNIFFNQTPNYAFVENIFTAPRGWLVVFMAVFLAASIVGWYRMFKYGSTRVQTFALFGLSLTVSYFIGRYLIVGGQIIARRLDAIIALVAILFFMAALEWGLEKVKQKPKNVILIFIFFILFGAVGISASYSLGPDARVLSVAEYRSMTVIAQVEALNRNVCVIADTYPLLALEAISAERIVGGGFPIAPDFSQPERELVLNNLRAVGADSFFDIRYALAATGARHCWYVGPDGFMRKIGRE